MNRPAPVRHNAIIERVNSLLEGEFFWNDRIHSVPFALPDDQITFHREKRGKRRRTVVDSITHAESSSIRIEPDCPYAGNCGGCRGRHLPYPEQFRIKSSPVVKAMEKEFALTPAPLMARNINSYRNRMDFVVEGELVGLRPVGNYRSFVDIEHCKLQSDASNTILSLMRQLLQRHPGIGFQRRGRSGVLKYICIRNGKDGSGVVVLTISGPLQDSQEYRNFREDLLQAFSYSTHHHPALKNYSLVEAILPDPRSEVSAPAGGTALVGNSWFDAQMSGMDFRVPYDAFFQPNPALFGEMLDQTIGWIDALTHSSQSETRELVDLFCGAGALSAIITARLPGRFTDVVGWEMVESAINLSSDNFHHFAGKTRFGVMDLQKTPLALFHSLKAPLIVADPPRAGLGASLKKRLTEEKPSRYLLYISCNPASQIEDLKELSSAYRPVKALLADPFPHTPHLEQAVLLEAI